MMDEVDRILVSEEMLTPSGGFLASVMEALPQGGEYMTAIRFPWGRFAVGLTGGLLCTLLSVAILLGRDSPELRPLGTGTGMQTILWTRPTELLFMMIGLAGSLFVVRLSVDLTGE